MIIQNTKASCGIACVNICRVIYNKPILKDDYLASAIKDNDVLTEGTDSEELEKILKKAKLKSFPSIDTGNQFVLSSSIYWAEQTLEDGFPCIINVLNDTHWIVIIGKLGKRFVIADPDYSKKNRKRSGIYTATRKELVKLWRNKKQIYISLRVFL